MSDKINLTKVQVELIEELAHAHEMMGMQPAWAKIVALLSVSDEIELTFDQIKDTLGLSKSAVSQALSQLALTKKVTYKTKIGDRKRYFHLRINEWKSQGADMFNAIGNMVEVQKKVLAKRSPKTKEFNKTLSELTFFLTKIHTEAIENIKN